MSIRWLQAAVAVAVLLWQQPTRAQVAPQPARQLAYTNSTALRINPQALANINVTSYRLRLYESASDVAAQNFVGVGLSSMFTPAFARVGPIVEIQPLTILNLFASYEGYGYFGTFDLLASFPSAASEYGPDQLDELDGEAELGSQLTLGATLQLKAGPFAVRSELRMMRPDFTLPDGQRVLYDQQYDMLVADGGWMLNNDVSAVWLSDFGLVAGLRYSFTDAYYRDEDFLPGEDPGPADDNRLQRLGAIVAYTLDRTPGGRYSRPTLLLIAQWHLEHRYRTGQQVSRALPLLALGFQFRGDLLDGGR